MEPPSANRESVEQLAEEFVERFRRGERPALTEYTERYPEHAEQIRDLFPALVLMEQIAPDSDSSRVSARPLPPLMEPAKQLGDYRILREIGRGGMGIVYEAEQVSLGRHVALKVLPQQLLPDSMQRQRFEREARSAAKLHHTNIVPVFGVGEENGLQYYVMQYIPGLGLDAVLDELRRLRPANRVSDPPPVAGEPSACRPVNIPAGAVARSLVTGVFERPRGVAPNAGRGERENLSGQDATPVGGSPETPLSSTSSIVLPGQSGDGRDSKRHTYWHSVAHIGVQVAEALAYAHEQGVLHRDIKPANLLLDTQGRVWITDFGLAKVEDQQNLTHTGDMIGTLRYMAPEVFNGKADARSEVYALGLTLYEMLALRPAFDETDRHQLVKQVTTSEPARLDKLLRGIPRDLVTIVHKAIDRDPEHRYQTARELADDLGRFLAGEPVRAQRASVWDRGVKWTRRRPAIAALVAVSVLAILGLLAGTLWHNAKLATALAQTRRLYYAASMRVVQQAWEHHNISRVHELLDQTADFPERGFEWYYWQRLCHADYLTLVGHTGGVTAVAFAPDGRRLATTGRDRTTRIWDATTGRQLVCLRGHQSPVTSVAFEPGGKWLVTGSTDGTAKLWDVSTGNELRPLGGLNTSSVWAVAVTPDGRRVVTGGQDGMARVWDAGSGKELVTLNGSMALPHLAASTAGLLGTPQLQRSLLAACALYPGRTGHIQAIWAVAVTPDGKQVVTAGQDNLAFLWDAVSGRLLRSFVGDYHWVDRGINSVAVTPDGKRMITAGNDNTAKIWDMETGRQLFTVSMETGWVLSVAVTPDGQRFVTGHSTGAAKMWETASLPDKSASTVGLLSSPQTPGPFLAVSALYPGRADTACAREILTLMGNRDGLTCVAVSPDGKRLATASMDGTARVWDLASGRGTCTLLGHTAAVRSIAATPDGRRIVTGSFDKTAKVWDAASGRQLLNLMGHTDGVWRVAVTRDGRRIITGSADGTARVWDAQNGQQLLKLEAERGIRAMALTPDGQRLVTGSFEVAQLWDLGSGQQLRQFKGPRAIISRLAITPDGQRVVMACWDGTTRLLDINTGQEVLKLQEAASGVASVAVAPRGKWLITGRGDGTATVWNIANGREMLSLNGHTDLVTSIAVTPDEQRIATASVDGTVRLWDAQSGRELLTLNPHTGPVWSVAVTPDGRRLITGGNDGTVKIWEAASPEETAAWVRQDQEAERRGAAWQRPGAKAPGFTQDWLVLGPLAVNDNLTGAKRLERQQLPGEAHLHPRAGDHVSVGGEEYAWYAHHWDEPLLDFNRLAQKPNKNRVIYAVCYVISPAERYDLLLQVGSSGPAKLYLNGREVYKCIRNNLGALDPVGPIRLRKGTNVLIVKMVDLVPGGCLRFVDADGNSARGLRVSFIQEP